MQRARFGGNRLALHATGFAVVGRVNKNHQRRKDLLPQPIQGSVDERIIRGLTYVSLVFSRYMGILPGAPSVVANGRHALMSA